MPDAMQGEAVFRIDVGIDLGLQGAKESRAAGQHL